MSLSLDQVFEKAKEQEVALVFDDPIYYLVLNTETNSFTENFID